MLIDLINDYKNVYFPSNVCLGVFEMVFIKILKIISMKRSHDTYTFLT